MQLRLINDRIAVRRIEPLEQVGLIVTPEVMEIPSQEGVVVWAGPGARNKRGQRISMSVRPGDRVLFGQFAGMRLLINGEELLFMRQSDLIGAVEGVD